MSPIKQRLLEAIERTPESILEQTLAFLELTILLVSIGGQKPGFCVNICPKNRQFLEETGFFA